MQRLDFESACSSLRRVVITRPLSMTQDAPQVRAQVGTAGIEGLWRSIRTWDGRFEDSKSRTARVFWEVTVVRVSVYCACGSRGGNTMGFEAMVLPACFDRAVSVFWMSRRMRLFVHTALSK